MPAKKANNATKKAAPKKAAPKKVAPKTRIPQKSEGEIPLEHVSNKKAATIGIIILLIIIGLFIVAIQTGYIHKVENESDGSNVTTTTIRDDRLDYDEEGKPHFKRAGE